MLINIRSISVVLFLGLLVGCNIGPGPTPGPTGSPIPPPTPSPTPSPTPTQTAGEIDHPTDAHAVVLRVESDVGIAPVGFFVTQAPDFTLYGDGSVIYRQVDTRGGDPFSTQAMLPFLVGRLDEEAVQALLRFALGQGRLLDAREQYEQNTCPDCPVTTFTLDAAGLAKTVNVDGLGTVEGVGPDATDRHGFLQLAEALRAFEERGRSGDLGQVADYDPAFYRVVLLEPEDVTSEPQTWPWADVAIGDFKVEEGDPYTRADLDRAHVAALTAVPNGGRVGVYVEAANDMIWEIAIRPLLPDELAAAGLD